MNDIVAMITASILAWSVVGICAIIVMWRRWVAYPQRRHVVLKELAGFISVGLICLLFLTHG